MSAFWIIGILANVLLLGVGIYWVMKQWKQNDPKRRQRKE
jgi:hypothetical protein